MGCVAPGSPQQKGKHQKLITQGLTTSTKVSSTGLSAAGALAPPGIGQKIGHAGTTLQVAQNVAQIGSKVNNVVKNQSPENDRLKDQLKKINPATNPIERSNIQQQAAENQPHPSAGNKDEPKRQEPKHIDKSQIKVEKKELDIVRNNAQGQHPKSDIAKKEQQEQHKDKKPLHQGHQQPPSWIAASHTPLKDEVQLEKSKAQLRQQGEIKEYQVEQKAANPEKIPNFESLIKQAEPLQPISHLKEPERNIVSKVNKSDLQIQERIPEPASRITDNEIAKSSFQKDSKVSVTQKASEIIDDQVHEQPKNFPYKGFLWQSKIGID